MVGDSGLSGTQVSYHYDGDELIRIVCSGYNELGQWGKEYYRIDGELQFVYMSQEYFNDKKPVDAPMSWKDLPTDEYRIYIKKGKQVAVSPAGWKGTVPALLKEYDALMRWGK